MLMKKYRYKDRQGISHVCSNVIAATLKSYGAKVEEFMEEVNERYHITVLCGENIPYSKVKDFKDDISALEWAQDLADIYGGSVHDVRVVETGRLVDHTQIGEMKKV